MEAPRDRSFGDRLYLRLRPPHASWVFRYTAATGKRREMGLGRAQLRGVDDADPESIEFARARAAEAARLIDSGLDPIEHRDQVKASTRDIALREQAEKRRAEQERLHWTLARCARDYHERVIEPSRTTKHAAQWIASLENHIPAKLWSKPISEITERELVEAVAGIDPHGRARVKSQWLLETKTRIAGRLRAIFSDAILHDRSERNPASDLAEHLQRRAPRRIVTHWRSLAYAKAPELFKSLRRQPGVGASALELTLLTAARTAETLSAQWQEFNLLSATWHVPAERMKGRRPHTVHLSASALLVLERMKGLDPIYVFPSPTNQGEPLSQMGMLCVLDQIGARKETTVHGLRATFSTWANETKAARPEVVEAALAHVVSGQERPYNRSEYLRERAQLLDAWALYLTGGAPLP